jgi:probable F420-dependent oxidoreductase
MKIGANLITNDTTLSILEVAPLVEQAGLDGLFQGEHSHVPVDTVYGASADGTVPEFYKRFPDLLVTLAAAAAVTTRIRLGFGIALVAEHQPLRLAKGVASLDALSGGRVDFGVGYGWNEPEMANNGVPPERRHEIFREKLEVVTRLWAEDVVEHDGPAVSFTPSWSYPKPHQTAGGRPGPPILIGAGATKRAFADVLERADGWYPLAGPELVDDAARLRRMAAERGVSTSVTAVVMAGQFPGAPWYIDDDATRRQLVDDVRRYADGGIDRLVVGVPVDERSRLEDALAVLADLHEGEHDGDR